MEKSNGNKDPSLCSNSQVSKTKTKKCNKTGCSNKTVTVEANVPKRPSLLDILRNDQDCNCEVVARAVRSNVHMNLGLPEREVKHTKNQDLLKKN